MHRYEIVEQLMDRCKELINHILDDAEGPSCR